MTRSENSGPSFYFNWSNSKPDQNVVNTFGWMGINYIHDKAIVTIKPSHLL